MLRKKPKKMLRKKSQIRRPHMILGKKSCMDQWPKLTSQQISWRIIIFGMLNDIVYGVV